MVIFLPISFCQIQKLQRGFIFLETPIKMFTALVALAITLNSDVFIWYSSTL